MVGDRDHPAAAFHRHQYRVQRNVGRIRLRQDELPAGWRIGRNFHYSSRVADIDTNFRLLWPFPAEGVEQCQGRRSPTGHIHHQIGLQRLRVSRSGIKPNTMHGRMRRHRYDPRYPALRPQRDIPDCFGPASQHQFDQRPRRTQQ